MLLIKVKGSIVKEVRLLDISHVVLLGNVQITTQALRELCARNMPVCFHSYGGWFYGLAQSMVHKNIELRIAQYDGASDPEMSLNVAKSIVVGKVRNQRTMLRRLHPDTPKSALAELSRLARLAEAARRMISLSELARFH